MNFSTKAQKRCFAPGCKMPQVLITLQLAVSSHKAVLQCWVTLPMHKITTLSAHLVPNNWIKEIWERFVILMFRTVWLYEGSFHHLKCFVLSGSYWNEMYFCVFIGVHSSTLLLPASLILALLTVLFIGFWRVDEGICFGHSLPVYWDPTDIQEAETCCSYPSLCVSWQITGTELKFLDKSYLWRNKRRQYFVGLSCSFCGSIWHFYAKGQITSSITTMK